VRTGETGRVGVAVTVLDGDVLDGAGVGDDGTVGVGLGRSAVRARVTVGAAVGTVRQAAAQIKAMLRTVTYLDTRLSHPLEDRQALLYFSSRRNVLKIRA
jgi:hypothetical protein